ncbi:hypothetical protein ACFX13_038107 [Malus domestica]
MIESMGNASRQSSTDRNSFGRSCAVTKHSTRATRSLEHPGKVTPHPTHTSTMSFLTPGRIRVDLDGPVLWSLPVKDWTGSSSKGSYFLDPIVTFHTS